MPRNHIPQTHSSAGWRHWWEISWQRSHSVCLLERQFQATTVDCIPAVWVAPEVAGVGIGVSSCLQLLISECRHVGTVQVCGSFLVSGIFFTLLPFGFYSPCSILPLINFSLLELPGLDCPKPTFMLPPEYYSYSSPHLDHVALHCL